MMGSTGQSRALNCRHLSLQISTGDPPLIARLGQLERAVLAQAYASDAWKQQRDSDKAAEKAAAAAAAGAEGATAAANGSSIAPDPSRSGSPVSMLTRALAGDAGDASDALAGDVDGGAGEEEGVVQMDTGADGTPGAR